MAILHRSGNISGSIGPNVYRTWAGRTVIQSKPRKFRQTLATKESSREFGLICSTAKIIRQALSPAYEVYDGKMINRMNSAVSAAVRNSPSKSRGERDLHDGDIRRLNGFEFNTDSPLSKALPIMPESTPAAGGKLLIRLPGQRLSLTPKCRYSTLRMLVTAFNLREEWYHYVKHEDIELQGSTPLVEGREWLIDKAIDNIPAGSIILVSFSLHAVKYNQMEGRSMNSAEWSPAAITGAHIVEGEPVSEWKDIVIGERREAGLQDFTYAGNELLKDILYIRLRHIPTSNEKLKTDGKRKPAWQEGNKLVLPSGKISFSK